MSTTGTEEILGRNGDEHAALAAVGQSVESFPEIMQKVLDHCAVMVQEAQEEAKAYPDPESAAQMILKAKLNAMSEDVLREFEEQYAKPKHLPT